MFMQERDYYNHLVRWLSQDRLGAYARRIPQPGSELDVLAYYLWNVALSERLYSTIQAVEIAVRNSLHNALSDTYDTERWFSDPSGPTLLNWQNERVMKVLQGLEKRDQRRLRTPHPPPPVPGRVVAELNFGFWIALFNNEFDPSVHPLWRGDLLIKSFPNIPPDESSRKRNRKSYRNRKALSIPLNRVLNLRNRISHHEPIWYWKAPPIQNLGEQHDEALELLGWIDPMLRETAQLLDEFPAVYGQGPAPYRVKLTSFISALDLS